MNRDTLIRALRTFIRGMLVRDRLYVMDLNDFSDVEELASRLVGPMLQELENGGTYGLQNCPILHSLYKEMRDEAAQMFAPHIWNGGVSGAGGYPRQASSLSSVLGEHLGEQLGQLYQQILFDTPVAVHDGESVVITMRGVATSDPLLRPRTQHLGYPE